MAGGARVRTMRPPVRKTVLLIRGFAFPEGHPVGPTIHRNFVFRRVGGGRSDFYCKTRLDHHPAVVILPSPCPGIAVEGSCSDFVTAAAIKSLFRVHLLVSVVSEDGQRGAGAT